MYVCLDKTLFYAVADIECAKSFTKMAESAKALASQQVSNFVVSSIDFNEHELLLLTRSFIEGIHAFPRDLHDGFHERHRVQSAGSANSGHSAKPQVHTGISLN